MIVLKIVEINFFLHLSINVFLILFLQISEWMNKVYQHLLIDIRRLDLNTID